MHNSRYIIALLILLSALISKAQTIQLNYQSQTKTLLPKPNKIDLRRGETYRFQINAINSALYQPVFKFQNRSISEERPDILKALLPQITNIANTEDGESDGNRGSKYDIYLEDIQQLSDKALMRLTSIDTTARAMVKRLNSSSYTSQNQQRDARTITGAFLDQFLRPETDTLKLLALVERDINSMQLYVDAVNNLIKSRAADAIDTSKYLNVYLAINENYRIVKQNQQQYRRSIRFLLNSRNATDHVFTEYFEADKDVVTFDMRLVNRWTGDTIVKKKLDYYTFGGITFNFSTGFFADNLTESAYYLSAKDSDFNFVLPEENRSVEPSIGALIHMSIPVNPRFKIGPVLGAAISPLSAKTRYLIGGGAVWGTKKLFSISAGLSMAELNVLSNRVELDTETNQSILPASVTEIPTYKKLTYGWFIGLTYNLTRK